MPIRTYADVISTRRSIYELLDDSALTEEEVEQLVACALEATPSPMNVQSARAVILFAQQNHRFWELVEEAYDAVADAGGADGAVDGATGGACVAGIVGALGTDDPDAVEDRLYALSEGFGTILFYEDEDALAALAEAHPELSGVIHEWAAQANGMLQSNVWNLLEDAGVGANLQHCNEQVEAGARKLWGIPEGWRLVAQMPFGSITGLPRDKDVVPGRKRMLVFK